MRGCGARRMKRWRVVYFTDLEEAESYLNGLSLQPDQIKGLFAKPATAEDDTAGMVLVCWLNAQQQRDYWRWRHQHDDIR